MLRSVAALPPVERVPSPVAVGARQDTRDLDCTAQAKFRCGLPGCCFTFCSARQLAAHWRDAHPLRELLLPQCDNPCCSTAPRTLTKRPRPSVSPCSPTKMRHRSPRTTPSVSPVKGIHGASQRRAHSNRQPQASPLTASPSLPAHSPFFKVEPCCPTGTLSFADFNLQQTQQVPLVRSTFSPSCPDATLEDIKYKSQSPASSPWLPTYNSIKMESCTADCQSPILSLSFLAWQQLQWRTQQVPLARSTLVAPTTSAAIQPQPTMQQLQGTGFSRKLQPNIVGWYVEQPEKDSASELGTATATQETLATLYDTKAILYDAISRRKLSDADLTKPVVCLASAHQQVLETSAMLHARGQGPEQVEALGQELFVVLRDVATLEAESSSPGDDQARRGVQEAAGDTRTHYVAVARLPHCAGEASGAVAHHQTP
eukprot:TRINITY_DN1990_c0_g2_i1.p1 TRINITY_DN1990_c0_g2~~TRINITY_DN1990_c0_g2_i1.p1  ORF type:complete len:441 (-),score=52.19 TRINITY_DN1990_c0_g2_i1:103-1389(-)